MEPFTVLTYNVRHATLDDGRDAWPRRRPGVRALLREVAPAVLGLQESTGEQHADIAADVPHYDWVGVAAQPGSGEHNPIGAGTRFDVQESETAWLSETPTVAGSVGWDAAYARVLTRVTLESEAGQRLTVFNTHFDHRGPEARAESARLVRRRVDAVPPDQPAVVLGDLNCRPESTPYAVLTGEGFDRLLRDARRAADTVAGPETTVTTFTDLDPGRRLDHVFVTDDLDVRRYATLDRTDDAGRYPSDHLPVAVSLAVDR